MDNTPQHNREERPRKTERRPYVAPEILSQEIFETTALACGKKVGQGGPKCGPSPRLS